MDGPPMDMQQNSLQRLEPREMKKTIASGLRLRQHLRREVFQPN